MTTVQFHIELLKGTRCLGSVELVFERSITVCKKMHIGRKIF